MPTISFMMASKISRDTCLSAMSDPTFCTVWVEWGRLVDAQKRFVGAGQR